MSTDEEFSAFVAARADHLYRQAWLLTGTRQAAEDLVQTALTKTYAGWSRVRRADDPVAYVHGVLMKTFLSDRRRRRQRGGAARRSARPAGTSRPDEHRGRPPGAGRCAGRPRATTDRAVVVLRYWDDRSVADTAQAARAERGRGQEPQPSSPAPAGRRPVGPSRHPPRTRPHPREPAMNDARRDPGARRAAPRHRRPDRPGHQPHRDRCRAWPQPPPASTRGRRGRHPLRGDARRRPCRDGPRRLEPHHRSADRDGPDTHPERDAHAEPTPHLVDNDAWAQMPAGEMATTFESLAPAGIGLTDVMLTNEERAPDKPETHSPGYLIADLTLDGETVGGLNSILYVTGQRASRYSCPGNLTSPDECVEIKDADDQVVGRRSVSTRGEVVVNEVVLVRPNGGLVYVARRPTRRITSRVRARPLPARRCRSPSTSSRTSPRTTRGSATSLRRTRRDPATRQRIPCRSGGIFWHSTVGGRCLDRRMSSTYAEPLDLVERGLDDLAAIEPGYQQRPRKQQFLLRLARAKARLVAEGSASSRPSTTSPTPP